MALYFADPPSAPEISPSTTWRGIRCRSVEVAERLRGEIANVERKLAIGLCSSDKKKRRESALEKMKKKLTILDVVNERKTIPPSAPQTLWG